ncbi:MAG: TonB-dependent receptor [Vicinamibacterales bacterium]
MSRILPVIVLALIIGTSLAAQVQPANLSGVVTDTKAQVVPGVTVTLSGRGVPKVAVTGDDGRYQFTSIEPGVYKLRFELEGFRPVERPETVVAAGQPTTADASLEIQLVETVTVTAQLREESLQEVPISITALTPIALDRSGITDISRLQFQTPGLQLGRAGEDARPAMRGARTENVGPVNDAVVGFYVDGVYKTRFRQAFNAFVDVERVEVQRGPQGTLFGRNTFGGNINIVTKSPENKLDFGFDAILGNYARRKFEGFLNAPLGNRAQFRLAVASERRDGYIKNTGPAPDIWDEDINYVRGAIRLIPAGNVTLLARVTHWNQGGNGAGDFGYISLGTVRDPATGLISLAGVRDPVSSRRGTLGSVLDKPYEVNRDIPLTRDNTENVGTLEATVLLKHAQIKSITSYTDFESFIQNDGDYSSNVHALEQFNEDLTSFTQELQVSSTGTSRLSWIVGLFHLSDEFGGRFLFNRQFLDIPGPPDTATATTTTPNPAGLSSNLESLDTTSNAVFGQATYAITSRLHATGGLRYTKDEKTYSNLNEVTRLFSTGFGGISVHDLNNSWTKTTWKGALDYQFTPEHMVFGTVSTGFVAGGFAFAAPTLVYNPQEVTAYEFGTKNTIGGRTQLNAAAYYADYRDLLASAFTADPTTGAVFTYQTNAGKVKSKGIELELQTVPVTGLNIKASAAFQDSKYGDFIFPNPFPRSGGRAIPGTNLLNLDGTRVQQNPRTRLSIGAGYDIDLGKGGVLTPYVQEYYSSEYSTNDVVYGADRVTVQPGYNKTDLRLYWAPKSRRFTVQAFVENLENEAVITRITRGGDNFIQGGYAAPRTGGVKLHFKY